MKRIVYLFICLFAGSVNASLIGPSPYLEFSDSPFAGGSFDYFHLEDFEDHLLNTPGVSASTGVITSDIFSGTIIDSVDGDDGNASNGSCLGCDSYFATSGSTGITFTFDANILGSLPTSVGIVWTDGEGTINFEAFGLSGSLGTLSGSHADSNFFGNTDDDRFYGVTDMSGISSIFISNTSGGIEVDHLQYGRASNSGGGPSVPEPTRIALLIIGLAGIGFSRKKKLA